MKDFDPWKQMKIGFEFEFLTPAINKLINKHTKTNNIQKRQLEDVFKTYGLEHVWNFYSDSSVKNFKRNGFQSCEIATTPKSSVLALKDAKVVLHVLNNVLKADTNRSCGIHVNIEYLEQFSKLHYVLGFSPDNEYWGNHDVKKYNKHRKSWFPIIQRFRSKTDNIEDLNTMFESYLETRWDSGSEGCYVVNFDALFKKDGLKKVENRLLGGDYLSSEHTFSRIVEIVDNWLMCFDPAVSEPGVGVTMNWVDSWLEHHLKIAAKK